ncbi:MAG: class I SAM-dependent methyltransferase [Methanotrichaceae archaeon]|nr:class I SAM-dependent methyltransferase [Methanotrichaceae archaeon]
MNAHLDAWDRDYRRRGRLWGGGTKNLPELPEGSKVLELGCGDGKTLAAMEGRFWDVTAIDISPEALRLSRSALGAEVSLLLADARHLPFKGESFDAVFAFHVTGHVLRTGRELIAREVGRVLRPGGRLFFREFGAEDMRAGRGEEVEPGTFRRGGGVITHYFSEGEVVDLFSDMKPLSIQIRRWKMRIKGEDFWRSEVEAIFLRS